MTSYPPLERSSNTNRFYLLNDSEDNLTGINDDTGDTLPTRNLRNRVQRSNTRRRNTCSVDIDSILVGCRCALLLAMTLGLPLIIITSFIFPGLFSNLFEDFTGNHSVVISGLNQ